MRHMGARPWWWFSGCTGFRLRRELEPSGRPSRVGHPDAEPIRRRPSPASERGLAESRGRHEIPPWRRTALINRSDALQALGKVDKGSVEEALRIFTQAGDSGEKRARPTSWATFSSRRETSKGAAVSFRRGIAAADRIGFVLQKATAVAEPVARRLDPGRHAGGGETRPRSELDLARRSRLGDSSHGD